MGQALYRTYRSKKLSEIVGQEHITDALARALKNGTVSHAYLFTGPRGTGKTSIARILAHEINQLPYSEDRPHLDIIEIDAASNRRIDEIRDLRDKVHIAPASAKYKVYIIDEVHMLTKEAFNALLKTLEEPPAHAIFILATTEVHKLPETIISRTQRFAFKPVELAKVIAHLSSIAKQEGVRIDDDALELIAAHGEGSFRDSISLLDQARHAADRVTLADVQALLGIAPAELVQALLDGMTAGDPAAVVLSLKTTRERGYEPAQTARQVGRLLRDGLIAGTPVLPVEATLELLEKLIQVPASPNPAMSLELALVGTALAVHGPASAGTGSPTGGPSDDGAKQPKAKPIMAAHAAHPVAPAPVASTEPLAELAADPLPPVSPPPAPDQPPLAPPEPPVRTDSTTLTPELWQTVLAQLKLQHTTLHTAARFARTSFEPGQVTLHFNYDFHQKRFKDAHNRQAISQIIQEVTGHDMQVACVVDDQAAAMPPPDPGEVVHSVAAAPAPMPATPQRTAQAAPPAAPVTAPPADPAVATISNIFGGAEVLES